MHVATLCVVYSLKLVKTGGPLYLAFAMPTRSGEIISTSIYCVMRNYCSNKHSRVFSVGVISEKTFANPPSNVHSSHIQFCTFKGS